MLSNYIIYVMISIVFVDVDMIMLCYILSMALQGAEIVYIVVLHTVVTMYVCM